MSLVQSTRHPPGGPQFENLCCSVTAPSTVWLPAADVRVRVLRDRDSTHALTAADRRDGESCHIADSYCILEAASGAGPPACVATVWGGGPRIL
jgi:hypothetical protein